MSMQSGKAFGSRIAHRLLNMLGIEVRLLRNMRAARIAELRGREVEAWRLLESHQFRTILDIGANEGQFARIARELWPQAIVHSFEPLPQVFATLAENFAGDPLTHAHNLALSGRAGSQVMHCSAFSPSSSLLPMAQLHRDEWPQSAQHTEVEVRLERLDDWATGVETLKGPVLVKIDVQGFELHVIDGGQDLLRAAHVIVLEVSFVKFYEGQPLFADIHERMSGLGFTYRGNVEQFNSKDSTHALYADAIFENLRMKKDL
jgi:FkbM family methyltransferase